MNIDLAKKDEIPQQFTSAEMTEIKNAISQETANVNIKPYHTYSPNEQVVGEWREYRTVEGQQVLMEKPVYEKTITGTTPSSTGEISVTGFSNVDTMYVDKFIVSNQAGYTVNGGFWEGGVAYIFSDIKASNNDVKLYFALSSHFASQPFKCVVQYTKTTDQWETVG